MADHKNDIYKKLPGEILPNDFINSEKYIENLLKAVPANDGAKSIEKVVHFLPRRKKHKKQEKTPKQNKFVTRKEKQKLNLLKIPKTGWDYKAFEPLRKMWKEYIISFLNLNPEVPVNTNNKMFSNIPTMLGKADFHGAEMTVTRSKCPSLVGITGTCILDSQNTFKILSTDSKARTVPKKDSLFKIEILNLELSLFGKYFTHRPAERSVKKIKNQMVPDL